MAKYKVGQKVKVREGLKEGKYGEVWFNVNMEELCGKELTIASVTGSCVGRYYVKENNWVWSDEMLADVKPKPESRVLPIEETAKMEIYVERVIVNDPATIMFYRVGDYDHNTGDFKQWSDTKKIVAKCNAGADDKYDVGKGTRVALLKAFRKEIDKQLRKM